MTAAVHEVGHPQADPEFVLDDQDRQRSAIGRGRLPSIVIILLRQTMGDHGETSPQPKLCFHATGRRRSTETQ
ncbi:MAG: hypothetical protein ACRC67_24475 [Inquilinus sp.]|uniref:hypothetical protein n=1 Tax=Inquilinus sp. TaxID=1932117 RepID=UPI003F3A4A10